MATSEQRKPQIKEGDAYTRNGERYVVAWVCDSGPGVVVGLDGPGSTWAGDVTCMLAEGFRRVKQEAKP